MRSTETAQFSAAVALLANAFLCAAVLVILRSYGMPLSEMLSPEFEARPRVIFFLSAVVVSVGGAVVLLGSKALEKAYRVALLLVWFALGAVCLKYGSVMVLSWVFGAWYLWRVANEERA